MRRIRGFWPAAAGGVMLLGLAAPAAADAELIFRYAYDNVDEIQAGLDEFERRNPGITVELERIAFKDARDQFIREAATGGGPDVLHLAFVWIKDLGEAEACMQLNELVEEHGIGEVGWDDFIATDLTYGADGESFYGVPFATDTWAMVYNTAVMAEAGVAQIPATWDELLEASRKVKAIGKIGFGFAAGTSSANTIWFLANFNWWSDGGSLVVDDGQGGYKVGITPEQVAGVIDYYKTYLDEGLTTEGSLGIDNWSDPAVLEPMLRGEQFAGDPAGVRRGQAVRRLARAQSRPGAAVHHGDDAARLGPADDPPRRPVLVRQRQYGISRGILEADAVAELVGVLRELQPGILPGAEEPAGEAAVPRGDDRLRGPVQQGRAQLGPVRARAGRDRQHVEPDLAQLRRGVHRREDLAGGGRGASGLRAEPAVSRAAATA